MISLGSTATVRNGWSGRPPPPVPHCCSITLQHGLFGQLHGPQTLRTRPSLQLAGALEVRAAYANSGVISAIGSQPGPEPYSVTVSGGVAAASSIASLPSRPGRRRQLAHRLIVVRRLLLLGSSREDILFTDHVVEGDVEVADLTGARLRKHERLLGDADLRGLRRRRRGPGPLRIRRRRLAADREHQRDHLLDPAGDSIEQLGQEADPAPDRRADGAARRPRRCARSIEPGRS